MLSTVERLSQLSCPDRLWLAAAAASACDKTPVDWSFTVRRLAGKMLCLPVAGTDLSGDVEVSMTDMVSRTDFKATPTGDWH